MAGSSEDQLKSSQGQGFFFAAHLSTWHSKHAQQQDDGSMAVQGFRTWTGDLKAAKKPQLFIPVWSWATDFNGYFNLTDKK